MPAFLRFASFFIMFRGRTVRLRRQLVLRGGAQVCLAGDFLLCVGHLNPRLMLASGRIPIKRSFKFRRGRRGL